MYDLICSGAGLTYSKSMMTDPYVDFRVNPDAIGPIRPGMRLLNIHLTRQIDACPRALHDDMPSNGRFKVIIYSGAEKDQDLTDFGNLLASPSSFLNRFTEPSARNASPTYETVTFGPANSDFSFDCFLIHSLNRHQNPIADFPEPFKTWRWRIFHDVRNEVADYWGLDQPAAIIVRPDGYVGVIRSIGDRFIAAASQYFDSFMIDVK
jgi:phenol 2-monooxygenase